MNYRNEKKQIEAYVEEKFKQYIEKYYKSDLKAKDDWKKMTLNKA